MPQISFEEVFNYLRDNKYILISKKMWFCANSFQEEAKKLQKDSPLHPILPIDHSLTLVAMYKGIPDLPYDVLMLRLIMDSNIPKKLEGSRGEYYDTNKYHEGAAKELKKILNTNIDYVMLVRTIQLYYKSATGFKKKISNYILDGDWRSDYMSLTLAAEAGEKQLKDHIKEQKGNDEPTKFRY